MVCGSALEAYRQDKLVWFADTWAGGERGVGFVVSEQDGIEDSNLTIPPEVGELNQ